ncbi:MAG: hypothetical protein DRI34_03355 [Deltaproteobacteria bacterium]|nr:MAG: hypothetical protein DRI34_03355 [Deltaproteobacteria bacterium]
MAENNEVESLRQRVAELERQLAEEREEFEWDLKAARESAEATVQKLERQLADLQQGKGADEDAELLARRAMKAERRVSELEYELRKLKKEPRRASQKDDSFLRQRAEEAEREREELRKRLRSVERELGESREALRREQEQRQRQERELAELAASSSEKAAAAGEAEQLRRRLEEVQQQLHQKEERISELASELNELSAADSERGRLAEERQRLQQQLQETRQRVEQLQKLDEDHVEKIAELSKRAEQAENELARLKMASGQMMEQRERETERLKSDLQEAERRDARASEQVEEMQRKLQQLQLEMEQVKSERDQAVGELRLLRDRQTTQVSPVPEAAAGAATDPFEESTVKAPMPAGAATESARSETVRDGVPLGAAASSGQEQQAPPPPQADESPAAGEPESPVEAGPLDGDEERIAEEWLEQPAGQAAAADTAAPLEKQVTDPAGQPRQQRRSKTGTAIVSREREEGGQEQVDTEPVPGQERAARPRPAGGGRKFPWVGVLVVAAAVGLVVVAWRFFPVWFGLGERPAGPGDGVDDQVAAAVDAGSPATADGSAAAADQAVVATADSAPAAEEEQAVDAGVPDASAGQEEAETVPRPTTAQLRLHKSLARDLARRRFARAARVAGRALGKYPRDPVLHYLHGRALFALRKRERARQELERAVELDAGLAPAHYELIGVYLVQGDRERACRSARKFLELSQPTSRQARAVRRNLGKWGCPREPTAGNLPE